MLKALAKKIVKSDVARTIACAIGAQYIRFVWWTTRWTTIGKENLESVRQNDTAGILCLWHGRLLMAPCTWERRGPFKMLVSSHRDGELISNTIKHLGIDTIAGSSTRGGAGAFRQLIKTLKGGVWVGITPDGPRGPRMRATDGVITMARLSGAPIVPLTYGISNGKILGSWDRFLLALPFSKGVVIYGKPMRIARDANDADISKARASIEETLNDLTRQADELSGREPVTPAPPATEQAA